MPTLTSDNIAGVWTKLVFTTGDGKLKDTSGGGTTDAEITLTAPHINEAVDLTSTSTELNALDGIDFATGGAAKLNQAIARDQINNALGTAKASTNLTLDANKDATAIRNLTGTGTFQAGILTATSTGAIPALTSTTSVTTPLVTNSGAVDLTAGATSTWKTTSGNIVVDSNAGTLTLDGHSGITIDSQLGAVSIDGTNINIGIAEDTPIDIDASTLDIDASTSIEIDTADLSIDSTDTTNLTMTANAHADKTMTIAASNSGAGDGKIAITGDTITFTGTVVGDNNTTYSSANFLANGAATTLGATTTVTTASSKDFLVSGAGLANLTSTANSTNAVLLYANSADSKVNIESNVSTASDSVRLKSNNGGVKILAEHTDANGKVLIQGNGSGYGIDLLGNAAPVQVTRGSTGKTDHLRIANTADSYYSHFGAVIKAVSVGHELQMTFGESEKYALLFIRKRGGGVAANYALGMAYVSSGNVASWINIAPSSGGLSPAALSTPTDFKLRIPTGEVANSTVEITQLGGGNFISALASVTSVGG
tara:strand:+ start:1263 stop:2882 length:1620 start_codon:yes stop_codon:yes gene_type:complete